MKTEVKKLPKAELSITIELNPEDIKPYEEEATRRISENVEVKGFRKGQAPKYLVIAQIGPEVFAEEILSIALPESYFDAIQKEKLEVISRPEIKVLSQSPLKYEARVATIPEIKMSGIDDIKIAHEDAEVSEKELDEIIHEMRRYHATYSPLADEVQKGDRIEIDFSGFDEGGAALDKLSSKNHPLFVGEGTLIPGFEEELVGMKIGEAKKFPLNFPKDFQHEPLRSKKVNFEVTIKKAERPVLPELTPEFAEKILGAKKTVEEMREAIKTDVKARKAQELRHTRENKLLEAFLAKSKFDVPEILVREEVDYMIADLKKDVEVRGMKFETFIEEMKKKSKDLAKEYQPEAEKRVRVRLILNYLFKTIPIEVSPVEMDDACAKLISASAENERARIKQELEKQGAIFERLKNNILLEKLFKRFLE